MQLGIVYFSIQYLSMELSVPSTMQSCSNQSVRVSYARACVHARVGACLRVCVHVRFKPTINLNRDPVSHSNIYVEHPPEDTTFVCVLNAHTAQNGRHLHRDVTTLLGHIRNLC